MALSHTFREILRKYGGNWNHCTNASKAWVLTFFSVGPPPVAVDYLKGKRGGVFFEALVKLSDVRKVLDARAVLVATPGRISKDEIQLATNSEVYLVLDGDSKSLEAALSGSDVSEVNRASQEGLMTRRNRSASRECRALELDLLSKKWMTLRELEEQLHWRFGARTVKNQIRLLRRENKISVCGRTNSGEGLLGTPDGRYKMRPDLSAPTKSMLLTREIVHLVGAEAKPLGYLGISERLGVKAHMATATLRKLAKEGVVEKKGDGWILAIDIQEAADKYRQKRKMHE